MTTAGKIGLVFLGLVVVGGGITAAVLIHKKSVTPVTPPPVSTTTTSTQTQETINGGIETGFKNIFNGLHVSLA